MSFGVGFCLILFTYLCKPLECERVNAHRKNYDKEISQRAENEHFTVAAEERFKHALKRNN
jgi:hypothetical protein